MESRILLGGHWWRNPPCNAEDNLCTEHLAIEVLDVLREGLSWLLLDAAQVTRGWGEGVLD